MSPAQKKKKESGFKIKPKLMSNGIQHFDNLLAKSFKYREDYEFVKNKISGTYDKCTTEYNSYRKKITDDFKGLNKTFSKSLKESGESLNFQKKAVGEFDVQDVARIYLWNQNVLKYQEFLKMIYLE